MSQINFPGGSKSRVNRAGSAVREGNATPEDLAVIEEWRSSHRAVLNTFQAILRTRSRGTNVTVAQRHKRKNTIFDKLQRLPRMQLARMDDIAGCRLIFKDLETLQEFRENLLNAKFKHIHRHDKDKYDYIAHPKSTGYRGIHDVYEYNVRSKQGEKYSGLYVEIQYRTAVQHAWATAVEVIGIISESQPKFQQGDNRYEHAMSLSSEILARSCEGKLGPHPDLSNHELVTQFLSIDHDLGLLSTLRGLNSADEAVSEKQNAILVFSESKELTVYTYRDATDALRRLFELESDLPDHDIVLVRASTTEDVRYAFKNYFSDAGDFIRLVEEGCRQLTNTPATISDAYT